MDYESTLEKAPTSRQREVVRFLHDCAFWFRDNKLLRPALGVENPQTTSSMSETLSIIQETKSPSTEELPEETNP